MHNTIKITIVNKGIKKEYQAGILLKDILADQYPDENKKYLTALVNNCNRDLSYPIYFNRRIEFMDITSEIGHQTYRLSLAFVLYKAVNELYPNATLRIEHAISGGYLCFVNNIDIDNETIAPIIKKKMQEIIDQDIPFILQNDESDEVIKLFEKAKLCDKIDLIKEKGDIYTSYYSLGDTIDTFYNPLVPSTSYLKLFDLQSYGNGLLVTTPSRENPQKIMTAINQPKLLEVFTEFSEWNKTLDVNNFSNINKKSQNKDIFGYMMIAEALQEKKVVKISEMIKERDTIRIILISGPSSSGKTTFGKRLAIQLLLSGLQPVNLSLDDYYVDRELSPLDENGEYDFEHIEALNIPLLNEQLQNLLDGKDVYLPKYDFKEGKSILETTATRLQDNQVLVVEGIHALNPQLTAEILECVKFKIYVSALTTVSLDNHNYIPTSENRLIRRIVRDYSYRGTSAEDNINRWQSVRNGENKWIYPYQEEADVMFNSSLLFEIPVLKPFIEPILKEVKRNSKAYSKARNLLKFLSYIHPIDSNKIPPTSLLREFLGGSSFRY